VLLQVHGGAWIIGNKEQQAMPLMAHMADNGWICVSINYRLSPRATWPAHIVDVKRALAWVKANIADYGGDPDFVCITGGSAGGHLSSLAALSANQPVFQPGFEDIDTSVAAAVPFYGVYDWTNRDGSGRNDMEDMLARLVLKSRREDAPEVWEEASTMSWVGPDAPPFFVIHGTNDSLVPVEQARSFVAMLRDVSHHPVVYAELPGAQHAFEVFDSARTLFTVGAVHRFLETIRQRDQHVADAG
jgi:acetyl esterase/lipase